MKLKTLPWVWILIGLLTGVDALWLAMGHVGIARGSVIACLSAVGVMAACAALYTYIRPDERLAAIASYAAKLFGYSFSLAIFGYLTVTLRYPLIDGWLAAADRAVGFDWTAYYGWVEAHRAVRWILIAAYDSLIPQVAILMTVMISLRRYDRAQTLLWLYIVSSLSYTVVSGFLPAAGAFGFYETATNTPYLQQFLGLRDGAISTLNLTRLQGVVQFPSFHFALAIMCAYVTRGIRFLFPVFFGLNGLVVLATPPIGGHFLADLWVSAILMTGIIYAVERQMKAARATVAETECFERQEYEGVG